MKHTHRNSDAITFAIYLAMLVVLILSMAGCASSKTIERTEEVREVYDGKTVVVQDTVVVHDTTRVNVEVYDTMRVSVTENNYTDSSGVMHSDRTERVEVTHNERNDAYRVLERENKELRHECDSLRNVSQKVVEKEREKIVEKKVYVWWPMWIGIAMAVISMIVPQECWGKIFAYIKKLIKK